MNGAEAAAEAIKLRPQLRILFITGYADTDVLSSWTDIGYRTLTKPFDSEQLGEALRQAVKRPGRENVVAFPRLG
jgi:DNA-binding NtrC family response regulator